MQKPGNYINIIIDLRYVAEKLTEKSVPKKNNGGKMIKFILSVLAAIILPLSLAFSGEVPRIEIFSPEGTIKNVRQATAKFSEQMVPFGNPGLSDPFNIQCVEKGNGRWVDGRTWSYDFERDLPAGISCIFTLKPEIRTISGNKITGQDKFFFNTGGPAVRSIIPEEGSARIDEHQIFILSLDAEPDEKSIIQNVYCSVEGIKERVGVRLIKGEEKEKLFKTIEYREDKVPSLVLQCKQAFPPHSEVRIVWGKGVKSANNISIVKDQVLTFKSRSPFHANFSCMKERPDAACVPIAPMKLVFSAPVLWNTARQITLKSKTGKIWEPKKEDNYYAGFTDSITFEGPFPEKSSLTLYMPVVIKDDSGRLLANKDKFPMTIKTDTYPALAKFPSRFGIIEMHEGAALPLTVRNIETEIKTWLTNSDKSQKTAGPALNDTEQTTKETEENLRGALHKVNQGKEEKVIKWLGMIASAQREKSLLKNTKEVQTMSIPRPGKIRDFEIIGIPLKDYGFYIVEIESRMLGSRLLKKPGPMYVPTAVLVTNMAVHFKWGRESSLVWVTSLDRGEPVSGASVTLRDCTGKILWEVATDDNGIARINTSLPLENSLPQCNTDREGQGEYSPVLSNIRGGLFIFASKGKDISFTHSSWDEGIEPWRFNLSGYHNSKKADFIAHTVLDRTLLRAGEEIHMKHFIRERTTSGLFIPSGMDKFEELVIEHAGREQKYSASLKWSSKGTAATSFKIPERAKLGTYEIYYVKKSGNQKTKPAERLNAGSFRVEEFRVPLMKAIIQGPKQSVINLEEIDVDISVKYLSGGNASNLPVKIRADVQPKYLSFEDFEEFNFSGGRVKTGIAKSDIYEDEEESQDTGKIKREKKIKTIELNLDKTGTARAKISNLPVSVIPEDILVELEYGDPNGEIQTVSSRIPVYPSKVLAGINVQSQNISTDSVKYKVAAVDIQGKPVPNAEIKVKIYQKKVYSHRRRVAGGFYAYDNITDTQLIGQHCSGKTDEKGIICCEGKSPVTGETALEAEVADDVGNTSFTKQYIWIPGKEDQWLEARNDDRIDLIAEKQKYDPGENARFQVKMPFREAYALITVEREGIMDVYTRKLARNDSFIEIPVKDNYVPNVFISTLIVKGRSSDTKPTAFFDPGKPAYKLGISGIKVGWTSHELKVKVSTDKKAYNIREEVEVKIKATGLSAENQHAGSEIALAVVDEGLLELKANQSWKILEAMMQKKEYEVKTSTAQMMVIGKRHFGRKALPHGGGGGRQITRELFDTLVYWNGNVKLDEKGEASLKFKLNDSLSSFRIVAVAAGSNVFGTGETSIRTTQDLMLLSGFPVLVREGDKFKGIFTVRNASLRDMNVEAKLSVKGLKEKKEMETSTLAVPAGEAREISWEIIAPFHKDLQESRNSSALRTDETTILSGGGKIKIPIVEYEGSVREIEGKSSDNLIFTQKVLEAIKTRTFQAFLTQIKTPLTVKMKIPENAIPGRGGISLLLKPGLHDSLPGVIEYMENYSYTCLEQKLSKAVALRDSNMWKSIMDELPSYIDQEGLVKYFPSMRLGSDVLTSYLLSVSKEADYKIPENPRKRILAGMQEFIEGRIKRQSNLAAADLSIRKIAALEALSRYDKVKPELPGSITIEPNLWPISAVLDWINILIRVKDIPDRIGKLKEAENILRSRLNLQGTAMMLSAEKADSLWWLMTSPDVNAAKTLLTTLKLDNWKDDNPLIGQGMMERMREGRWDTTVANAWGKLATEKFSKIFESAPVTGITSSRMNLKTEVLDWSKVPGGEKIFFPWHKNSETFEISHNGKGKPWATIRSLAAIPPKENQSSGFKIKKKLTPLEQKEKGIWSIGDVIRVNLELESQTDMTWVAVNDPVPAGAVILGSGLGRDSILLTSSEIERGRAWETFRERSLEALRVYYEYIPKGKWTIEYTLRLNNSGSFYLPETRVEALYVPDVFGEISNKKMDIK